MTLTEFRLPMIVMSSTIATTVAWIGLYAWTPATRETVLHVKSLEELTSLCVNPEDSLSCRFAAGQKTCCALLWV